MKKNDTCEMRFQTETIKMKKKIHNGKNYRILKQAMISFGKDLKSTDYKLNYEIINEFHKNACNTQQNAHVKGTSEQLNSK